MVCRRITAQRFILAVKTGQLEGDGPALVWTIPVSLSPLSPNDVDVMHGAVKEGKNPGRPLVIVGRFEFAGDGLLLKSSRDTFSFMKAFGHLGCCPSRIVLEHVEIAHDAR